MSSNRRTSKQQTQFVTGYIVVEADQNGYSDDDSDADDDDDWLDDDQMSAVALGGNLVKQNSVKLQRVTIKELKEGGKTYVCKGPFPLVDPWWKVRCHIYPVNRSNVYLVDHTRPIINEIRTDQDVVNHKLMNLFLGKVLKTSTLKTVAQQELHLDAFEKFTKEHELTRTLYFNKFEELYKRFDELSDHYALERIWRDYISRSVELKLVKSAIEFHELFVFLSQLRPKHFISVFQSTSSAMWQKLDKCREDFPWEFGFSTIMYKQYGLIGFEATLGDFLRVGILEDFPAVHQDALYIYDFLKKDARQNGHTYIEFGRIKYSKFVNAYRVVTWADSLKYLEQHAIVKTEGEKLSPDMKIFLKRNWQAENDVAKCLNKLVMRGADTNWSVDFSSEEFDKLHSDPDQWRAVHLVTNSPLAVLSGKGGCGKTTVVTELLKYVCTHCVSENIEAQLNQTTDQSNGAESSFNQSDSWETSINQTIVGDNNMSQPMESKCYKSPWQSYREMKEEEDDDEDESDDDDNDRYLSKTTIGQTILLTAPTGKAANLLGRKASMESCTLHHVIMSFKGFCKRKADYLKAKNESMRPDKKDHDRENSNDEDQESESGPSNLKEEIPDEEEFAHNLGNKNSEDFDNFTESSEKEPIKPNIDPEMPTWKYENKSVLVVDECSLVSVRTIATVLNNLQKHGGLSKVILIGDVRQLPSVEPGNFLVDIFCVLSPFSLCVELKTNHRAESELIVHNATKISQRKLPNYEAGKFQLVEVDMKDGDTEVDQKIRELLETSIDLNHETSQFVSFQRRRCESINELCCKFYNNHITRDGKRKFDFRVGDKVCMSKNAEILNFKARLPAKNKTLYSSGIDSSRNQGMSGAGMETMLGEATEAPEAEKVKKKKMKGNKKIKLCNGEVFFIVKDVTETENNGKTNRYITLSDKEKPKEKLICVNFRDLIKRCKMRHGWARTIHTYQGSESSSVVYVVYKSYHENWQHVYTAVTRGRNSVYMVGKKCLIDKAITTDKKDRRTSLQQKLMDKLKDAPEVLQEIKSQLVSLLEKSDKDRKEKEIQRDDKVEEETDEWGDGEDWNDEYIEALCHLLPEEEEGSDRSRGSNMSKNDAKGQNSFSTFSNDTMDTDVGEGNFNLESNSSRKNLNNHQNVQFIDLSSNHLNKHDLIPLSARNNHQSLTNKCSLSSNRGQSTVMDCDRNRGFTYTSITSFSDQSSTAHNSLIKGDNSFSKGNNSDSFVKEGNSLPKEHNSDSLVMEDSSFSKECNSGSFLDSDDSFIKTLDESGLILSSQLAEKSNQFNLASAAADEDDDLFDDIDHKSWPNEADFGDANRIESISLSSNNSSLLDGDVLTRNLYASSSSENGSVSNMKRHSSATDEDVSPGKSQCVRDLNIVSPLRKNFQKTLNF